MEFEEYPLLNTPTLMLTVLRVAASAPARLEDCRAALERLLARADEHPDVGEAEVDAHLAKARDHLLGARLLEAVPPDRFAITARGRKTLSEHPTGVDDSILEQFAEFREYLRARAKRRHDDGEDIVAAKDYDHGYAAYLDGRSQRENPYDFDTAEHLLWDCGWFAALDEELEHRRRSRHRTSN